MSLSLKSKLILAGVTASAFTAGIGLLSSAKTRAVYEKNHSGYLNWVVPLKSFALGLSDVATMRGNLVAPLLGHLPVERIEALSADSESRIVRLKKMIQDEEASERSKSRSGRDEAAGARTLHAALDAFYMASRQGFQAEVAAARAGHLERSSDAVSSALHAAEAAQSALGELAITEDEILGDMSQDALALYQRSVTETLVMVALALLAMVGGAVWFASRLSQQLGAGVGALRSNAGQLREAAGQVSSASQALAGGSSQQAAALEESSAALEEMASTMRKTAEHALSAKTIADEVRAAAEEGAGNMAELSTAMDGIKASSDEIGKIIKTIDEIAFQTNMLALNAAVEAARAGEAGMGFAVVADEVRNLAQRSAQAAKETASKIEESIRRSQTGVESTHRAKETLEEIVQRSRKANEVATEIATASREQAAGIEQANMSVSRIDGITQKNAAVAEEVAAASEELTAQSATLEQVVHAVNAVLTGQGELEALAGGGAPPRRRLKRKPGATALKKVAPSSRHDQAAANDQIPLEGDDTFQDFAA